MCASQEAISRQSLLMREIDRAAEQLYRQGEVRSLSSWYRLWHSILSTSTSVGLNCRCTKRLMISNCAAGCTRARYSPRVVLGSSVTLRPGQGKTWRFASVLQRRAFTNWSTWHVASYVEAIGWLPGARVHWRQLKAFTAWGLNSTELTDLSPWLACISLSDRTASCRKRIAIRD